MTMAINLEIEESSYLTSLYKPGREILICRDEALAREYGTVCRLE
jgi:hypothetical protein